MKCLKCDGELHPVIKDGQSFYQCDKCGRLFTRHDLKYHTPTSQPQKPQPAEPEPDDDGYYTMGLPTTIIGWILCALLLLFGVASGSAIPLIAFIVAAVLVSPAFRNRVYLAGKVWIPLVVILAIAGLMAYPSSDTSPKKVAQKQEAPTPAPKQAKVSTKDKDKEDSEEQQAAKEKEETERAAQEQAEQNRLAQEQAAAQAERGQNSSSESEKAVAKKETPKDEDDKTKENSNKENFSFDFSDPNIPFGEQDIDGLKIKHGDLLSVIYNSGIVVIKTKIEPSFSNKATIDQNYFNVADLIKKHGFNTCNEIQYWAVADMSSGDEAKCISFTLDKITIDGLYNENIIENQLGDYATDLWILPSLRD